MGGMERARLGLIGMGLIGRAHVRTLMQIDTCELVAVADSDQSHAQAVEALALGYYANYEEMIDREHLQAVVIATPNHLHAPMAVACAERGLHLFVEKPIAPSLEEADRLIEAARRNRVQVLVGHQRRFNPRVEAARQIVTGGALGQLVGATITWALLKPPDYFEGRFAWRKSKGGGPILINLIHEIDNLRYICGEIAEVYAMTSNRVRRFPVEDTASVAFRFENGALGTAFISDCAPSLTAYEATTGENPLIYHDCGNCYHFFGASASLRFPQMQVLSYSDPSRQGWHHPITAQGVKIAPAEDPYVREIKHFCQVVAGKEAPRISGEDARRTLEATLAIQRSGECGEPIRLI